MQPSANVENIFFNFTEIRTKSTTHFVAIKDFMPQWCNTCSSSHRAQDSRPICSHNPSAVRDDWCFAPGPPPHTPCTDRNERERKSHQPSSNSCRMVSLSGLRASGNQRVQVAPTCGSLLSTCIMPPSANVEKYRIKQTHVECPKSTG